MAKILPSNIPDAELSRGFTAELQTLAFLKEQLPPDYVVFHSVDWSGETVDGRLRVGEADFIVVNRSGDCIVIEQKSGSLEERLGTIVKKYSDGDKDVVKQIHRTLNGIRSQFKAQSRRSISLDYILYCPHHKLRLLNSVGLASARIVDAQEADQLAIKIQTILGVGQTSQHGQHVFDFFANMFKLTPDVHSRIVAGERGLVRLTGGLADTISSIEMSPLRLRVCGTAGCGKSAVAATFAHRAATAGKKPLLICFNRPLSERLKSTLGAGIAVETFYGFLDRFLKERGHELDYRYMERSGFWADVQERVITEHIEPHWLFDTLIVDEGQDIEPEWVDILRLFLRPDADILWLEDFDQAIRTRNDNSVNASHLEFGTPFVTFRVRSNHRSPQTIARFISNALPFTFSALNLQDGLGVGVAGYTTLAEQSRRAAAIVTNLLRLGFSHEDIVIISLKGLAKASFAQQSAVGPYTLARPSGQYDAHGNQLLENGQLRFDTIYRFKGQQAPAIILIDVDFDVENDTHVQRLLFSAMTRATVRLDIVVKQQCIWFTRLQNALDAHLDQANI